MSLSSKGTVSKVKSLNPNAAEFIPFFLRSSSSPGISSSTNVFSSQTISGSVKLGKSVLDRSESSLSNNSDDEIRQYWRHQLPDDITPDFKVIMGQDDPLGINNFSFASLSLQDSHGAPKLSAFSPNSFITEKQFKLPYGEDILSSNSKQLSNKPWNDTTMKKDQLTTTGNPARGFLANIQIEQRMLENVNLSPFELLAMQFPGFSAESLADVYFANGGDLNPTVDMLTQLELQVDGGFNQNLNTEALSAPNLSSLDLRKYLGDDIQQSINNPYMSARKDNFLSFRTSSSSPTTESEGFSSALRELETQESNVWNYDRNGSADTVFGSNRSSHLLASNSFINGQSLQIQNSSRQAPLWIETGEAVENMYSDMQGEERDHPRLRNTYLEQARQAYLSGNKGLEKELKAVHERPHESIYHTRNSEISGNIGGGGGGNNERIVIDLHGLHATEAIHVLQRELAIVKARARTDNRQKMMTTMMQVFICIEINHHHYRHHTMGSRAAIQRYLLEEGLDYSEPQPGLLQVVVY